MSVEAKFLCVGVEKTKYWKEDIKFMYNITLHTVYDSDPNSINGHFYGATPGGEIKLNLVSEEAAKVFEPGEEYIVTFNNVIN